MIKGPHGGNIGPVIKRVKVPVCAVCGAEWLPKTPAWRKHPEQIRRCTRCKSRRWNDDDPKAATVKEITTEQRKQALRTVSRQRYRANLANRERLDVAREVAGKGKALGRPVRLCRHRVVASGCPLCK